MVRGDDEWGASAEIGSDASSVSVWITNILQIWYGR